MPDSAPVSARAAKARVDLLDARRPLGLHRQVDDRAGRQRDAHGVAVQLARELGDDQAERLRGAGGGGDQVQGGRARPAEVLVRRVVEVLVGGVGVDRRHQAVPDADGLVQDHRDRREAVGRAGGVGDDVVALGVVGVVVDAEDEVGVGRLVALGGGGEDDLAGAGVEVAARRRRGCGSGPVASITTSTPSSAHGSARGSRSALTAIRAVADLQARRRGSGPLRGSGRRSESKASRCASVAASATSLTATISRSAPRSTAARSTPRPMRPKPLMPTRVVMRSPCVRWSCRR